METPKDLKREHYPEFKKAIIEFKLVFGNIKREYIKAGNDEHGKKFEGEEVNPVISDKITNPKKNRRK